MNDSDSFLNDEIEKIKETIKQQDKDLIPTKLFLLPEKEKINESDLIKMSEGLQTYNIKSAGSSEYDTSEIIQSSTIDLNNISESVTTSCEQPCTSKKAFQQSNPVK